MLLRDKNPFAPDSEVEQTTGFSIKPQKRGLFKNTPSQITWKNLSLGRPLGWFFEPGWKK